MIKSMFGFQYLGGCNSSKLIKSKDRNVLIYGIYLAPHSLSGYNVCPESTECRKYCLNGSGLNKVELYTNTEGGKIQEARIRKTKMFFENREWFMRILCFEIELAKYQAEQQGMDFAVRLNCTSDINPEKFVLNDKNILEIFPDVQFYDYTKVYSRINLTKKYPKYDLTFSYSGTNWEQCQELLERGYRVAVVFNGKLPESMNGYPVINANEDDLRYQDKGGVICGLTYKKVANNYSIKNGKRTFKQPNTNFIVNTPSFNFPIPDGKKKSQALPPHLIHSKFDVMMNDLLFKTQLNNANNQLINTTNYV